MRWIDVGDSMLHSCRIVKELRLRQEEISVSKVDHVWGLCPTLPSLSLCFDLGGEVRSALRVVLDEAVFGSVYC